MIRGSWTILGVPRSHRHCQLSNFDWSAILPASTQQTILEFLVGVKQRKAPHLFLTGKPGAGKTHLSIGIYRAAALLFGTRTCCWIDSADFCRDVKQAFNDPDWAPFDAIEDARNLLVIDDLFGRALSGYDMDQSISQLIDTCYKNNAALVVTMNPDLPELAEHLAPHELSRILQNNIHIPIRANRDWRLK